MWRRGNSHELLVGTQSDQDPGILPLVSNDLSQKLYATMEKHKEVRGQPQSRKTKALQSLGSQGQRRLTDRAQHSFDTRHLETYVIHFNSCKAFPTKSTVY